VTVSYAVTVNEPLTGGVEIRNTATVTRTGDGAILSSTVGVLVEGADLGVHKSSSGGVWVPGETVVTYTVVVSNEGTSHVVGGEVWDAVPGEIEGATWTCEGSAGSTCSGSGSGDIADTVTVLAGGRLTYTLTGALSAGAGSSVSNRAVVSVASGLVDEDSGDNEWVDVRTLTGEADVSVSKRDEPGTVIAGEWVTYTIEVTNAGPSDASGVLVTDTVPASVTVVSANPAPSSQVGRELVWDLGTVPSGQHGTLVVVLEVGSEVVGTITNVVTATSGTTDSAPGNNEWAESTEVVREADLALSKVDSADPIVAGQAVTYTVVVTNVGPSDAYGVMVTDTLPTSVTVTSVSPATSTQVGGELVWDVGWLARGESRVLTVVVATGVEVSGTVTNTARVGTETPDPDPSTNQVTETTLNHARSGNRGDRSVYYQRR